MVVMSRGDPVSKQRSWYSKIAGMVSQSVLQSVSQSMLQSVLQSMSQSVSRTCEKP
jgi:hypothetical protein